MGNEILFNEKLGEYTLEEEIEGYKSIKRVPIKFSLSDNTSKYRKDLLKEELLNN